MDDKPDTSAKAAGFYFEAQVYVQINKVLTGNLPNLNELNDSQRKAIVAFEKQISLLPKDRQGQAINFRDSVQKAAAAVAQGWVKGIEEELGRRINGNDIRVKMISTEGDNTAGDLQMILSKELQRILSAKKITLELKFQSSSGMQTRYFTITDKELFKPKSFGEWLQKSPQNAKYWAGKYPYNEWATLLETMGLAEFLSQEFMGGGKEVLKLMVQKGAKQVNFQKNEGEIKYVVHANTIGMTITQADEFLKALEYLYGGTRYASKEEGIKYAINRGIDFYSSAGQQLARFGISSYGKDKKKNDVYSAVQNGATLDESGVNFSFGMYFTQKLLSDFQAIK